MPELARIPTCSSHVRCKYNRCPNPQVPVESNQHHKKPYLTYQSTIYPAYAQSSKAQAGHLGSQSPLLLRSGTTKVECAHSHQPHSCVVARLGSLLLSLGPPTDPCAAGMGHAQKMSVLGPQGMLGEGGQITAFASQLMQMGLHLHNKKLQC